MDGQNVGAPIINSRSDLDEAEKEMEKLGIDFE